MPQNYFKYVDLKSDLFEEAKIFLQTFTPRRTEIMCKAIEQAAGGNGKMLKAIRDFRAIPCKPIEYVETRDITIPSEDGGIQARVYSKKTESSAEKPIFLYLHGGGWTIGDINSCADFCQNVAASGMATVVAINYRRAPENPHPAALDDCICAYKWLLQNAGSQGLGTRNVFVSGDSAGGHLAIALADAAISLKLQNPQGLTLFYPVTTFEDRHSDESYKKYGKNYALDAKLMDTFNNVYIPEKDSRKDASPLNFKTLSKFPPTLILSSGCDILLNQDEDFANLLFKLNVKTRHVCIRGATHIYLTMPGMPQSFSMALQETLDFIKKTSS